MLMCFKLEVDYYSNEADKNKYKNVTIYVNKNQHSRS